MALVASQGRLKPVKNLGWLLRNWASVERFEVTDSKNELVAHRRGGGGLQPEAVLRAHMRDGKVFVTPFASRSVLSNFLDRPVFRGVPIRWFGTSTVVGKKDLRDNPLEENPSGGMWALGIAAVLGIGWLLLRKKDEPKTTPSTGTPPISPPVVTVTPTNTTSPREGTTPPTTPVIDFVPFFPAPCTFTSEQFDTWAKNNGKQAFWFQSAGMPPNVKDLPGADPLIAAQYVIASGNGALVWVYGAGGAPVVSPIVRNAVCKSLGFVTE